MQSNNTHQVALDRANASVREALGLVDGDPHYPGYHASPPVYWMNDPNGLIYYRGEYHLYYQHNPFSEKWGSIHWGHMKSKDMVHWEHAPVALAPSEPYDRDGCFSGSAVEHDGKMVVLYTSNRFTTPVGLPDDLLQQQCMAVSEDGAVLEKFVGNPVIGSPPGEIGQSNHFRDPKVWFHDGYWYMVLGAKKDGRGKVVSYRTADLMSADWHFFSVLTESDGTMGYMHECPDLFRLDCLDVLLLSPEGATKLNNERVPGYYMGKLDYASGVYEHDREEFYRLDHGFDFYAPQTFEAPGGRRILIGWMPMEGAALGKKWAGCMTVPRELSLNASGRRLRIRPVEEMKLLRGQHIAIPSVRVPDGEAVRFDGVAGDCAELVVEFDLSATDAEVFGIRVRASDDGREKTVISYEPRSGVMTFDRSSFGAGEKGEAYVTIEHVENEALQLQLFLDRSSVEVFVNDGECVMSGFVFPSPDSNGIEFFASGGTAAIKGVEFWTLSRKS